MTITDSQIRLTMSNARTADIKLFVPVFNAYSDLFGINTKLRAAHFLAQIAQESSELRRLEENLNYSEEGLLKVFPKYFNRESATRYARHPQMIANRVYASRMGNGNEQSGDGWRFRGRGLLQLTGKENYQKYAQSEYCNGDLLAHPEWLAKYPGALKSAMWYWLLRNINDLADNDDVEAVTKRINGGQNGLAQRMFFLRKAKKALWV